uniref:Uncharacterized protein n=1 Tax=Tanacetum cinerariifolium TaxID=118510 RepID=A0A6L2LTJ4_TANCI|nr:hypothetical protein [Tanacetum cinerariifolium]
MPSFPSPKPTVSYLDDLDFFKDFENEFPAIVYHDALTSKSDFLTELTLSPQHIDEFNLNDETSLSECDEEKQNVLYFNDLFSFNYDEDVHDLKSVETEFPTIVLNDALTSEVTLSCKPTVSPLNDNQIDFRISFDEFDDEDYTVICDKNSYSYKIIYVDNLKTDSENDYDKVDMPSFLSPKPTASYFDYLDFFKDFEIEFPAIAYNDALTSKSDFLTEPTLSPQHIDKFNLNDETSLSECDEEEQNVLYFNDLFPFNVIYPDDSKSDKDNDDDKIDVKQSLGNNVINTDGGAYAHGSNKLLETMKVTIVPLIQREDDTVAVLK